MSEIYQLTNARVVYAEAVTHYNTLMQLFEKSEKTNAKAVEIIEVVKTSLNIVRDKIQLLGGSVGNVIATTLIHPDIISGEPEEYICRVNDCLNNVEPFSAELILTGTSGASGGFFEASLLTDKSRIEQTLASLKRNNLLKGLYSPSIFKEVSLELHEIPQLRTTTQIEEFLSKNTLVKPKPRPKLTIINGSSPNVLSESDPS